MKTFSRSGKVPLAAKIAFTAFMAVMVPFYWSHYGPTNFLYFCDVAMFATLVGIWTESALLISMAAVGILLPQVLWIVDFAGNVAGLHLTGMTDYMFDSKKPLFTRGLSLFHGWLPVLLVWLLSRLGYDKRALPAWSATAIVLVAVSYLFMPLAGEQPADPNIPVNINYVCGFNDAEPQHWMHPHLYVFGWTVALVSLAFVPTHLVLRKVFRPAAGNSVGSETASNELLVPA